MNPFAQALAAAIAGHTGLPETDVARLIEVPKDPKMGDLAFPCFQLAKAQKKAPPVIAKELAAALGAVKGLASVAAAGPYVNARVDAGAFAKAVLDEVAAKGE